MSNFFQYGLALALFIFPDLMACSCFSVLVASELPVSLI